MHQVERAQLRLGNTIEMAEVESSYFGTGFPPGIRPCSLKYCVDFFLRQHFLHKTGALGRVLQSNAILMADHFLDAHPVIPSNRHDFTPRNHGSVHHNFHIILNLAIKLDH
jgi:hypothetical protein